MIVSKTVGVEGRLRKTLSTMHGINFAFIYGSYALRKEKGSSDIDLMIIGNPDTSLLNEKIAELEKRLKREINPTIYSFEEYQGKKKVKSGFMMELLRDPKIMVIGKKDDL
jgi:predicted nucleotidyltransferase